MTDKQDDTGVTEAVLERLNTYRLPRLLELKERVDRGETITDNDLQLLEQIMHDGRAIQPLVERQPELQPLYAKVTALYGEITAKAVANEQKPRR